MPRRRLRLRRVPLFARPSLGKGQALAEKPELEGIGDLDLALWAHRGGEKGSEGEGEKGSGSAGMNRHIVGDERALQERKKKRFHPGLESCAGRREAAGEA